MRLRAILIFLVLAVVSSLAQVDPSLLLPQNYPVPNWVKPGLVVVYQHEGGTQSGGGESAASGKGFRIDIVTDIEKNTVYGIEFIVLVSPSTYQITFQPFKVMPLFVFIHPNAVQDLLKKSDMYAKQGIVVRGGRVSENSIWLGIAYNVSSQDFWISNEGLVQRVQVLVKQREGSAVVMSQNVKHFYIEWPNIKEFPPVARESHTYNIYTSMYGFTNLAGSSSYRLSNVQGRVARYSILQSTSGMSTPTESMGVPSFGPFYIHPSLLKKDVILQIPEIGLVWKNEQGMYGVDTVVYFKGQECFRASFDERGLLMGVQHLYSGLIFSAELIQ